MKMLRFLGMGCFLVAFSACQNDENVNMEDLTLKMQASVANVSLSRTSSTVDGHTNFVEGDKIGFFMPQEDASKCWTLTAADGWKPDAKQTWPNQKDQFEFCAYYPYSTGAARTAIPMPDLSGQKGKLENIGEFDFLVAKKTCGFGDDSGNVSFTGDNAFRHVYALVLVTLVKNTEDATTSLKTADFGGTDVFRSRTYSFASPEGLTTVTGEEQNTLSLTLNEDVAEDGCRIAVLVNPSEAEKTLDFSVAYARDGINYKASTSAIKKAFQSGTCYKYKIRIEKEGLSVVGSDVVDWTMEEILEDIVIKDTPDTTE